MSVRDTFGTATPVFFAGVSIAAAITTMLLKALAWWLTGSVGLLSDALESLVNVSAAAVALWMLRIAARPPDDEHAYGHGKAEYFASGFEGAMIAVAAVSIIWTAVPRLLDPQPLQQTGIGLAVCTVAALINAAVARVLLAAGRRHRSLALEADARHLLTDVWTSAGVIAGVALVAVTGWLVLDPLLALAVAANILWTGWRLLRESAAGLMDAAWPHAERAQLEAILQRWRAEGVDFHAVRTRRAGARHFVSFHVLVPGAWSVQRAHDLVERIEAAIADELSPVSVLTHIEPIEDPVSHDDAHLDRPAPAGAAFDRTPP
ncbi:cation diffusion facilitator family transporter [Fontimonas thermophila]|uniref:Cation diffusion facilitator family transporter n=1 Tax=Fontimonas thermophila TaxID=1076937 RepID=A0A1I2JJZ8_9GAMM|nr:cation diffusion facilitator family transporter [Fontimonas thermophila]SFF54904.1 cation diffusion facilitator family transporter [Fontimonas thermophila]